MATKGTRTRRVIPLAIAVSILSSMFMALIALRAMMGFGITFHRSFQQVQPEMSESQVMAALGTPDEKSADFRLGQYEGFEHEYARAAQSDSTYYLRWHKGIDVVYTVGFDDQGQVTMKAVGGT